MIVRSRTAMLALAALLAAVISAPGAPAADITRGGQRAELTVTSGGAHSVRVTLKPVGMALPPNPSLLNLEIKNPAISLRTIDKPVKARVGALDVEITPSPLTVLVKSATGREIQKLVFDHKAGKVSLTVGDGPVLGLGEGGKQPGKRSGPMGVQFDRRGKLDVMRPGWGSGTLGSRNPVAVLVGTVGWGLFVASPWVQVDLRDPARGAFIPTNNVTPTAGVDCQDGHLQRAPDRSEVLTSAGRASIPRPARILPGITFFVRVRRSIKLRSQGRSQTVPPRVAGCSGAGRSVYFPYSPTHRAPGGLLADVPRPSRPSAS